MFISTAWFCFLCLILVGGFISHEKPGRPIPNDLFKISGKIHPILKLLWITRVILFVMIVFLSYESFYGLNTRPEGPTEVVLLDISKSMESDDVFPSRLEYAKSLIKEKVLHGDSFGLIVFAGKSFTLTPPSRDSAGLMTQIASIHTDMIRQDLPETSGTNIGDTIIHGLDLLQKKGSGSFLTLITDGRANIGLDPQIALEEAKKQQRKINTIAIGSLSGSIVSVTRDGVRTPLTGEGGEAITRDVDTALLSHIAEASSGSYQIFTGTGGRKNITQLPRSSYTEEISHERLMQSIVLFSFFHVILTTVQVILEKRRKRFAI